MGITYTGAYADLLDGHEGYAARVLPDGTVTGTWSVETRDFVAYVAACTCGWNADRRHPPTDGGEHDAELEWEDDHLQQLIEEATRSWDQWADRVARAARAVTDDVKHRRPSQAVATVHWLRDEVAKWAQVAQQLAAEQEEGRR